MPRVLRKTQRQRRTKLIRNQVRPRTLLLRLFKPLFRFESRFQRVLTQSR
jgi:hypothetical protein